MLFKTLIWFESYGRGSEGAFDGFDAEKTGSQQDQWSCGAWPSGSSRRWRQDAN